jgi:ABC-type glycerol-3-phosphate transport system substrate-binding protein
MPATPPTVKTEGPVMGVKQSPFRFLIPLLGGVLVLGLVGFLLFNILGVKLPFDGNSGTTESVELTYWGLWESEATMKTLIERYESDNPGVKINYTQQKSIDYRDRLQTALQNGTGPDLFRYHQTWIPMLRNELSSLPDSVFTRG